MMSLGEYRNRAALLSDFLPWAALVERGVVLNKDGSFQRKAKIRGPDLDSATPAELVGVTGRLNNALRRLGCVRGSAARARDSISRKLFPRCRFAHGRSRTPGAVRG
ncbi:type IV secretory pathway VirB4 component [Acetobacter oeni]|nr:type IV secretory pathway VirB4 component [Acetobacter oeni]